MSTPSLDPVRQRFEREAQSFDAIYRLERSPVWRFINTRLRKGIFQRYNTTFKYAGDVTGKAILDVGCGSGIYCVDFALKGARRVVGIDFSNNMLNLARARADQQNVTDVCEFILADFLNLDVRESFDVSIAMGVFDYLPDPGPFLQKMASVTTGKVIVSFPGYSLVRAPARRLRYKLLGKGDVYFYRRDIVEHLAAQAGLHKIVIRGGTRGKTSVLSDNGYVLIGER